MDAESCGMVTKIRLKGGEEGGWGKKSKRLGTPWVLCVCVSTWSVASGHMVGLYTDKLSVLETL